MTQVTQLNRKQLDKFILREAEKKEKDPYAAQQEQAEEQKFEKIKKMQELGERIHGQINNSFEHLNAFMSLGTKTRDTFEYKRAVAEIHRIQKLTADMATLVTQAHEAAEAEPEITPSQYNSEQMANMAQPPRSRIVNPNPQGKPSPHGMGMQEYKRYGGDPFWLTAKYGQCKKCHADLTGKKAFYYPKNKSAFCEKCGEAESNKFDAAAHDEDAYGMGMGENKYGVVMESYGSFKTVDVVAKSATEALLRVRKANPAWEVKKVITLQEGVFGGHAHLRVISPKEIKSISFLTKVKKSHENAIHNLRTTQGMENNGILTPEGELALRRIINGTIAHEMDMGANIATQSTSPLRSEDLNQIYKTIQSRFPYNESEDISDDEWITAYRGRKPQEEGEKPVKGSKPKPKPRPFPEPPSASEVPPGMKDIYERARK